MPPRQVVHRALSAEFDALREAITPELPATFPRDLLPLQPGDAFQPAKWHVRAIPRSDFYSVQLQLLVSPRVRAALTALKATGLTFAETVPFAKARASAALAATGYALVSVTATTGLPPGVDPATVCPECERAVLRWNDPQRELRVTAEMWPGTDVAYLATTRLIVVTDRVRQTVEAEGATGVRFEPADQPPTPRRTV